MVHILCAKLYLFLAKVLLFNGQATEIMDLVNPKFNFESRVEVPLRATRGFFGTIFQNQPIICGGIDYETRLHYVLQDFCIIGTPCKKLNMLEKRFYASCVELTKNILWIVGGKTRNNTRWKDTDLSSTEIITLTKAPIQGKIEIILNNGIAPPLPCHCSIFFFFFL